MSGSALPFLFAPPAGQKVAVVAAAPQQEDDDDEQAPEEEVTQIDGWTPSMTLEVLDTQSTGEEEEEVLYVQRSKLYRFAKESSEWKERGVGESKLLKHRGTGKDYADGEMKMEQFALKFPSLELAKEFEKAWAGAKELNKVVVQAGAKSEKPLEKSAEKVEEKSEDKEQPPATVAADASGAKEG